MSFQRLRTDFDFAILMALGSITLFGLAPFMLFRLADGQWLAFAIDSLIMLCICLALVHIWRGGSIARAALLVAATNSLGCVVVGMVLGLPGVLWAYVALIGNFLLLERQRATLASLLIIGFLIVHGGPFANVLERAMFAVTATVCAGFAFAFAYRAGLQRQQLESLAEHDPLTGAHNRRAMERELPIAIEASRRQQLPVGLAVLDLDYFKHINDAYGHEAGDRVLIDFAGLVIRATRKGDRFFRYGGEEFVLVLPGVDRRALRTVSEFLRASVAEQLRCGNERVTVSIGAATLAAGEDVAQWMARADAAMYQAKQRGRDQVVVADDPAPAEEPPPTTYRMKPRRFPLRPSSPASRKPPPK